MSITPQRLYTADQVRELDRSAIEDHGMDGYALMKRAGRVAYLLVRALFPRAGRVTIFCGTGNNGGDGYVAALLARQAGLHVDVLAAGTPKSDSAGRALRDFEAGGGRVNALDDELVRHGDVIVDALLGTGLQRAPAGQYANAVARINAAGRPVVAVDVPSGLHSDTGRALEPCVRAAATATFIGRKLGCFTGDGPDRAGAVHFDDLDVPAAVYAAVPWAATIIEPRRHAAALQRPATAHKGDAGRVLVVGGNTGMPGAPCMSARAAHRCGAGLVYLATRCRPAELVANTLESMATQIESPSDLDELFDRAEVIAVGPGLGRDDWAAAVWRRVLEADVPMVVDADALQCLAREPVNRPDWILTPHPGEAAALLNTGIREVLADRPSAVRALQERYGGIIVLKGPGTLILGDAMQLCDLGNAGMASGGMGDVLTGAVAALRAQGLAAEDAAAYGVWCHARSGDAAVPAGRVGLTAGDVIDRLADVAGAPVE